MADSNPLDTALNILLVAQQEEHKRLKLVQALRVVRRAWATSRGPKGSQPLLASAMNDLEDVLDMERPADLDKALNSAVINLEVSLGHR